MDAERPPSPHQSAASLGPDLAAIETRLDVARRELDRVMEQRKAALNRLTTIQAERAAAEAAASRVVD